MAVASYSLFPIPYSLFPIPCRPPARYFPARNPLHPHDPEAGAAHDGQARLHDGTGLVGSEILKIAADIRAMVAGGAEVCNLTVGDFSPAEFPIPQFLEREIVRALQAGETNYPPSDGVPQLRQAVKAFYEQWLGLDYPLESILVTGGSRPGIYGTYTAVVDPGDTVIYPGAVVEQQPLRAHGRRARRRPSSATSRTRSCPRARTLEPVIRGARLLALNSPLNPSGTAFTAEALAEICDLVLEENARRGPASARCT